MGWLVVQFAKMDDSGLLAFIAVLGLLAALIYAVLVPMFGPLAGLWHPLLWICLIAAFFWTIPALGLAAAVPLLRDPATRPPCWAVVSAAAAAAILLLAILRRSFWPLLLPVVPALGFQPFLRRARLDAYWGLAAISFAVILVSGGSAVLGAGSLAEFVGNAAALAPELTSPAPAVAAHVPAPSSLTSHEAGQWTMILSACLIFCFSFWTTMGLLAGWARAAPPAEPVSPQLAS